MKRMLLIGLCFVGHGVNCAYAWDDEQYNEDVEDALIEHGRDLDRVNNPFPPILDDPKWRDINQDIYNQQEFQRNSDIDAANKQFRNEMIDIQRKKNRGYYE